MAKVTLQSIADAVGVSRMTVSNAFSRPGKLSAELRVRILATAEQMGYVGPDPAARALARGRTGTICLLLTDRLGEAFRDAVATEFLSAVADELAEHELALTVVTSGYGREGVPARDVSMDGAIVYVCEPDSTDVQWLLRRRLPMVAVDQEFIEGIASVNVDDRAGARAAAQHLVDLGHRRIGILNVRRSGDGADPDELKSPPARQRQEGWHDVLDAAGVTPVTALAAFRPADAAQDAARALLSRPARPTAILCFCDAFAVQVLHAAESLGLRVPQDVSVVGFDDSPLATAVRPELTTVRQPVTAKGQRAVQLLLRALAGDVPPPEQGPERALLATELVVRASTSPPPADCP